MEQSVEGQRGSSRGKNTLSKKYGQIAVWFFVALLCVGIIIFGVWGVIYIAQNTENPAEIANTENSEFVTDEGELDTEAYRQKLQEIYQQMSDKTSAEQAVNNAVQSTIYQSDGRYSNQMILTEIELMNDNGNSNRALELIAQLNPDNLALPEKVRYYNALYLANQALANYVEANHYSQITYDLQKELDK